MTATTPKERAIELDTRLAWEAEQRKPKRNRRTHDEVATAIRDLYEGRNPYLAGPVEVNEIN